MSTLSSGKCCNGISPYDTIGALSYDILDVVLIRNIEGYFP